MVTMVDRDNFDEFELKWSVMRRRPEDWHTPLQALDPLPQSSLHEWSWPFQHFVDCFWWGWGCDHHRDLWLFEREHPPWPPWRGWRTALGKPQEERPSCPSSSPHWSGPNKDGSCLFLRDHRSKMPTKEGCSSLTSPRATTSSKTVSRSIFLSEVDDQIGLIMKSIIKLSVSISYFKVQSYQNSKQSDRKICLELPRQLKRTWRAHSQNKTLKEAINNYFEKLSVCPSPLPAPRRQILNLNQGASSSGDAWWRVSLSCL